LVTAGNQARPRITTPKPDKATRRNNRSAEAGAPDPHRHGGYPGQARAQAPGHHPRLAVL